MIRSVVKGWGAALPAQSVSNNDLVARGVDTTDEWIVQRTGIRQRYVAAPGELTSHLATAAGRKALEKAELAGGDIDLLVLATSTPDQTFPSTATKVQAELGMGNAPAFDVQAVCSGFLYALSIADGFIVSGKARRE